MSDLDLRQQFQAVEKGSSPLVQLLIALDRAGRCVEVDRAFRERALIRGDPSFLRSGDVIEIHEKHFPVMDPEPWVGEVVDRQYNANTRVHPRRELARRPAGPELPVVVELHPEGADVWRLVEMGPAD